MQTDQSSDEDHRKSTRTSASFVVTDRVHMPRPWSNLSDFEFEAVVGSLLGRDLGVRFERFTRGKDLGIDLRHNRGDGTSDIVQAKHYCGSTFAHLKSAARTEAERVRGFTTPPASYRLVTSLGLTPSNKQTIADAFKPIAIPAEHIIGRDDLESLMDLHSDIERIHIKLWITSGTQLHAMLNAEVYARSRSLIQSINTSLPLYVQGPSFMHARRMLRKNNIIVISGPPGIGKTTLARMLVAAAVREGHEPFEISENISEAWPVIDTDRRQVFLFDDFLGTTLNDELGKNEDKRIISFMREVAASPSALFVLTTREYILQQAVLLHETFARQGLSQERFLLELSQYSNFDRARILQNHVWHSPLPVEIKEEARTQLSTKYNRIVRHKNFNPRTIEYITGHQRGHAIEILDGHKWIDFAIRSLDNPEKIWSKAFHDLTDEAKLLLLCLCTFPDRTHIEDLRQAFETWAEFLLPGVHFRLFTRTLRIVLDTFVDSELISAETFLRVSNPGLLDFLQSHLRSEKRVLRAAITSSIFFEQLQSILKIHLRTPNPESERVIAEEMLPVVARLIELPGAAWDVISSGEGPRAFRPQLSPDRRFEWLMTQGRALSKAPGYSEIVSGLLRNRATAWARHQGEADCALRIVSAVESPSVETLASAASLLRARLWSISDWETLVTFMERYPECIHPDDTLELKEQFSGFSSDELERGEYIDYSEDDPSSLGSVADHFGIELDGDALREMRNRIAEHNHRTRTNTDDDSPEYYDDDDNDGERDHAMSEQEAISRLFKSTE